MNKIWRYAHKIYAKNNRFADKVARAFELLNYSLCSNGVSAKAEIGNNTNFFHHGIGCVVHADAIIGDNCVIFGNVTIGKKWSNGVNIGGPPKIGNNVMIGAGAVLLGDFTVGDNAIIGANAVVMIDVPENAMAVGIPAKIIKKEDKK